MAKKKKGELSKKEKKKLTELLERTRRPKTSPYSKGYVQVIIPIYRGFESMHSSVYNTLDNITALEKKLAEKKITFDTAYEPFTGNRIWDLDWSLSGAEPKKVLAYLQKNKILYRIKMIQDLK